MNPFDVLGQAEALHAALSMGRSERRRRAAALAARCATQRRRGTGSTACSPTSARVVGVTCAAGERALARRRAPARCSMVDVGGKPIAAPSRGRAGVRRDGAARPRAAARAPEGRRARDRAARRDHGREADGRADPALPPAAALARRRRPPRSSTAASRSAPTAETTAQTGVEMEALTAASVAALTVYDMAKAVDKDDDVHGRAGREGEGVNAAVLTVSDRVSRGEARDTSGDVLERSSARGRLRRRPARRARRGRRDRRGDRGARRRRRASC